MVAGTVLVDLTVVAGAVLACGVPLPQAEVRSSAVNQNTARVVLLILLLGAVDDYREHNRSRGQSGGADLAAPLD